MKRLAKIVREDFACDVVDSDYLTEQEIKDFIQEGFTWQEVEESWNGQWYLQDKCPTKPQSAYDEEELIELHYWFTTYYTEHEQKYRRLIRLGLLDDDGIDPNNKILDLDNEAEIKRKRIQELEN